MINLVSLSIKTYDRLLGLYPAAHRREYGDLMQECFREMCYIAWERGGTVALFRLWLRIGADALPSLLNEHLDAWENRHMQTIAHYQIKEHLQQGGAADIYLAHDPANDRDIILKVPLDTEKSFPVLFNSEAIISLDLSHPVAPQYYDYRTVGGETYLAMEYLQGSTLLELLEQPNTSFTEQQVIEWGITVCDFLTYLHEKSVVYGDMKPGNLFLDQFGKLRIIDFGVAHKLPAGATHIDSLAIGTEGYAPPEQYAGVMGTVGDIYALGATLHHLITGRDPRQPQSQFLFHIYNPRRLNPNLSEAFEAVILKATEHKAVDRYQTAQAMKAALEACLPSTSTIQQQESKPSRLLY